MIPVAAVVVFLVRISITLLVVGISCIPSLVSLVIVITVIVVFQSK
jgi:hypothetical protein